jgi:L-ribulose-5-phosphate 3-epimerase
MKIALSALIAGNLTMPELLQQAKDCGYDAVELSLRPAPEAALNFQTSDAQLAEIKQQAADLGLSIASMTISAPSGNLLQDGQSGDEGVTWAIRGLECAAKLGAKVCLHTLGRLSPELYYEDAYRNAIAAGKKIAAAAEKIGVTFAVEFVWNGFLFSPLEMRNFLDSINSPRVGFYFDPGNMAVFQFPQHWVRALGSRIKHVHLKDWKGGPLNGTWTALLAGEVNFPVVMQELRRAGYAGPLVSEVAPSLASFAETASAMRKIAAM